jgi:hypothetical protein
MRKSNIDTSKLPKFSSHEEAVEYFNRYGKLQYYGVATPPPVYYIYSYKRNDGIEYFIDIYPDGQCVVIQRGNDENKDF